MKNKKLKAVLIVVLIAAAAAVFIFRGAIKSAFLKRFRPDGYMAMVLVNTAGSLEREILKLPDSAGIKASPYDFSLSLGLKDYNIQGLPEDLKYTLEALKLISFTSNSKVDRKSRNLDNNISVLAGGINLTSLQAFFTDDLYAVRCETLSDKIITINPKTFVSDWNSSPVLVALTGLTMPDIVNVNGLNDFIFSDKSIYKNMDADLLAQLKSESVGFLMSGSGDAKYLGKENGYDIVETIYSKDKINELYKQCTNSLIGSFEDNFSTYLKLASDYGEAGAAAFEELKNDILSVSFDEDITVSYYIDGKDIVRRLETSEFGVKTASGNARAQVFVDLRGEEFLSDMVDLSMKLITDTEISVNATNVLKNSTREEIHHELRVEIEKAGGGASHLYALNWTPGTDSGAFDLAYDFDEAQGNKFKFRMNGQLNAGNGEVSFKNGIVSASYNENSLELKTGYTIKGHDGAVAFDNNNAYSFFDINILELNSIFMKAQNFLYSF